jgi:peptide-methionine (S)-S-oxide reductase
MIGMAVSRFAEAVAALDGGAIGALKALLHADPGLVHERASGEGYFRGATLLHHVAGNPIRCALPANILDVARLLLDRGADPNAPTEAGWSTAGLLLTSKQASEAGVALPLLDLLRARGARDEYLDGRAITWALANVAPATAAELIRRGAPMDLRHAAGLGRVADVERLLSIQADLREPALLLACIRGEESAARVLVEAGARGDVLVALDGEPVRTALHEAANRGHEGIVRMLLAHGASARVVEPRFGGTPAGWARHGGFPEIADLLHS